MEINEAKVRLIFIYPGGERKFVSKSAIMLFVTNPESVCRVTKPNQGLLSRWKEEPAKELV